MKRSKPLDCATLIFSVALLLSFPSLGVPVAVIGKSHDLWESKVDLRMPDGTCQSIGEQYYTSVSRERIAGAVAKLQSFAIVLLDDRSAAQLLDISLTGSKTLADEFLSTHADKMEQQRQSAEVHHVGSWSLANQEDLDRLNGIRIGPRLRNFKPYLVRALVESRLDDDGFGLTLCNDTIYVTHFSEGKMYSPPDRSAIVVFLDRPITKAVVQWAVHDPDAKDLP